MGLSTNEEKVLDYKDQLDGIAGEVRTQVNLTATKQTQILNKMDDVENLKAGLLNTVLNARFEINQKLMYTNDDQRKTALIEMKREDVDYQNALGELWMLEEEKKIAEAEAEYQRKLFKSVELAMTFYATNPK